jgi:hypothetical protein
MISTPDRSHRGDAERVVDHVVHDLLTVRLLDPPREVLDSVEGELGSSRGAPSLEPDLCVSFTDRIPRPPSLRMLDLGAAGYDESSFYIFNQAGHATRIDMDRLGEACTLVCERGVRSVPLLVPILGLRLLAKEHVLLHSAAFVYEGIGILVAGWKKGGKTELLLPFMSHGADYLSDEWTIVSADGQLRGLSGVLQLWSWHLRQFPQFWTHISRPDRLRLRLLRLYQRVYRVIPDRLKGDGVVAAVLERVSREGGVSAVGQVRVAPRTIFGDRVWDGAADLDRVFLASVTADGTRVTPLDPEEVARRMVSSLAYERTELLNAYNQYRFAFPERRNELIETAGQRELRLLSEALGGVPAYEITHPYPARLQDLHAAAAPYCR